METKKITKKITKEMYDLLKQPLPAAAVKKHPTKSYLSSIKAIYVTERLNDVFGCGSWSIKVEKTAEGNNGMVVVKTTLIIPEYHVYYECFGGNDNGGEGSKNFDLGDAYKGATTDAITKIGSYMGIGMSVFKGLGNVAEKEPLPPKVKLKPNVEMKNVDAVVSYLEGGKTLEQLKKYRNISKVVEVEILKRLNAKKEAK